ncbi:MAG: sortase [Coriobacteriaceae bacterium]|nr:MAG: sortase [Coriobacteriaceae bacterium]
MRQAIHSARAVLRHHCPESHAQNDLTIRRASHLLTLVTCTPYGVNDHRLLVHCERIEYVPEEAEAQGSLVNRCCESGQC